MLSKQYEELVTESERTDEIPAVGFMPRVLTRLPLESQRVAELIAFHLCDSVHVVNQLHVAAALLHVSASEHALLGADHHLGR